MINFIHPYPAIKASSQLKQANDSGSVPTQMNYTVKEIDRQTNLYKNPSIMESEDRFPHSIKMDHNELALRMLDKIS